MPELIRTWTLVRAGAGILLCVLSERNTLYQTIIFLNQTHESIYFRRVRIIPQLRRSWYYDCNLFMDVSIKTSRHRGLSLIELLVVVGVIALFLAILLPSLSGARAHSQATLCLTRLRQLGAGWQLYAEDHDDTAVPGRMFNAPGGASNPANWYDVGNGLKLRPRWVAMIGRYVGEYAFARPSTTDDRQDYDSKVYVCPTVAEWTDERNHAYGYNHQFLGNGRKTNGQFHNYPVNRSMIHSFGTTVMAADCLGTAGGLGTSVRKGYQNGGTDIASLGNHGWTLDPPRLAAESERGTGDPGSPRTGVDPRHRGRSNVIFCDGHGETLAPEKLGFRVGPDGRYEDEADGSGRPNNHLFSITGRDESPPLPPG
jgi:prepilin-type N-terminal cleavage/methylation domain-containing protein/prepilin-type processing-associated H-X9-DG protein